MKRWRGIGFDFQALILLSVVMVIVAVIMTGWGIQNGGLRGAAVLAAVVVALACLVVVWVQKLQARGGPRGRRS